MGALLAKSEIEVGVNQLLDALSELAPADGVIPDEQGLFTRGPGSLRVRFTPAAA